MTQEQKDLLLKDISARLSYGVKGLVTFNGNIFSNQANVEDRTIDGKLYDRFAVLQESWYDNVTIKPYLFPISSMTEEQQKEYDNTFEVIEDGEENVITFRPTLNTVDMLNKNHFDYRGLIPMDLAIDATGKNIY